MNEVRICVTCKQPFKVATESKHNTCGDRCYRKFNGFPPAPQVKYNPIVRNCAICKTPFGTTAQSVRRTCGHDCSVAYAKSMLADPETRKKNRLTSKLYQRSVEGKTVRALWLKSPNGIISMKKSLARLNKKRKEVRPN